MIEYFENDNLDYEAIEKYRRMPREELEALYEELLTKELRRIGKGNMKPSDFEVSKTL